MPPLLPEFVRSASDESSGQYPAQCPSNCRESSRQYPGNVWALSGLLLGNTSRNTDECPHNGWRICPEVSWQLPAKSASNPVAIHKLSVQHPTNRTTALQRLRTILCDNLAQPVNNTFPRTVRRAGFQSDSTGGQSDDSELREQQIERALRLHCMARSRRQGRTLLYPASPP